MAELVHVEGERLRAEIRDDGPVRVDAEARVQQTRHRGLER